jgi:hypothetical protein
VVSVTPWPLYSRGKSPRYPLDRRLDGPQSRSERHGKSLANKQELAVPSSGQEIMLKEIIKEIARMAQSVWRRVTGWNARIRFPAGIKDLSLLHCVQTGSGARPAFYPTGSRGPFPRSNTAGVWVWNGEAVTPLSDTSS